MGNVLKIDRMSLRDERIGKVWFWTRNNCQKLITLPNSRPLYMANKNIFFFYLLKIFYVSKMAILKCPSVTSRRDTFGQDIKIDIFFRESLDPWLKYRVFLCVSDTMMKYLVYRMGNNLEK